MDVQVEVQFTIQHTIEELKTVFVKRGHFPEWQLMDGVEPHHHRFSEMRIVSMNLSSEEDRLNWFVFSIEACGELRKRIVIPNVVPSSVKTHISDLREFLDFCRRCLLASPSAG